MSDSLQDFVLAYCEEVGGLIERPAYGLVDLLLPDEVARRLGVSEGAIRHRIKRYKLKFLSRA